MNSIKGDLTTQVLCREILFFFRDSGNAGYSGSTVLVFSGKVEWNDVQKILFLQLRGIIPFSLGSIPSIMNGDLVFSVHCSL